VWRAFGLEGRGAAGVGGRESPEDAGGYQAVKALRFHISLCGRYTEMVTAHPPRRAVIAVQKILSNSQRRDSMLKTKTMTTMLKPLPQDLTPALMSLSEAGWQPAVLESNRIFAELAGVTDKLDLEVLRRPRDSYRRRFSVAGDVFFRESDVYYMVANPGDYRIIDDVGRQVIRRTLEGEERSLEVGIVSSEPEGIDERLELFAKSVEEALKSTIGAQESSLTIEWHEIKPGTPHLDRITSVNQEESGTQFARAALTPECVQAAQVLSSRPNRDLLVELLQARFAREQDVLSRRPRYQEQIKKALGAMKSVGLIQTEFQLECKRTGTPLTRLSDPMQVEISQIADLICPSCGSKFSEETLLEGYSVSDLGRRMARQSHWMTVWTTNLLVRLGIPESGILWNISENGEEVDLLVEFLEELWIFELKDREFGAGDAHPLNYRQVRYEATKAVVFTTEKVSKDAKQVFEELQREARSSRIVRRRGHPVYIEGLDNAENVLRREIADVTLGYARRRLAMIGEACGYNLGAVLSARFGESIEISEEEETPFWL
jgi:hypothetical protein